MATDTQGQRCLEGLSRLIVDAPHPVQLIIVTKYTWHNRAERVNRAVMRDGTRYEFCEILVGLSYWQIMLKLNITCRHIVWSGGMTTFEDIPIYVED